MSLSEILLEYLLIHQTSYKETRCKLLGDTHPNLRNSRKTTDAVLRVILSRLKKRGLVENENGIWKITKQGVGLIRQLRKSSKNKISNKKMPKNMIIAFDIPEPLKSRRNWLRIELLNLDFVMLQKSLWFGPSPLPKEFLSSLNQMKLLSYIKFFEAKESEIV